MKAVNWEWYLQNACVLLEGDDKQFEWILGRLKSNLGDQFIDFDEDSPDYLFAKFRYRIISISYIKVALVLTHNDDGIDEDEFDDWNEKLQAIALLGNPNEHFTISGKSIEHIGLEKLKKPSTSFGKEAMASFHSDSLKLVNLHLRTVSETGEGQDVELGNALINLYLLCFEVFIDGELEEEDANLMLNYVSGHFRGQTNFAKSLINTFKDEEPEDEELEDEDEDEDEELEDEELEDEDDESEIPDREELESMTKAEIKSWADAFEFNVPSSLNKAEMIDRFVEETDEHVESSEDSDYWSWIIVLGAGLFGWFALAPLLSYLLEL